MTLTKCSMCIFQKWKFLKVLWCVRGRRPFLLQFVQFPQCVASASPTTPWLNFMGWEFRLDIIHWITFSFSFYYLYQILYGMWVSALHRVFHFIFVAKFSFQLAKHFRFVKDFPRRNILIVRMIDISERNYFPWISRHQNIPMIAHCQRNLICLRQNFIRIMITNHP